ncbi:MAG: bifunctional diaminohydroxyphosphoribosylaminopyrimidine deaminase/5-amino-6-(5-phosphoribosylamino)uracil reductase RibD [Planctomycetota bacterium]
MKRTAPPLHEKFMRRALALARRGMGRVGPNPAVGAVLVRNNRIVGEGWHRRFGGPHAEVEALRKAGRRAAGATLYVTLEPCSHFGKTPPCADAVIRAGVKAVVVAVRDPNPLVNGRGLRKLRAAGVGVTEGILQTEAEAMNAPFFHVMRTGTPWVTAKWAMTLDGKIAGPTPAFRRITGPAALREAHRLRGAADAILVGIGTVLADDPLLTCRLVRGRNPIRVILDSKARLPFRSRIVRTAKDVRTIVVTAPGAPAPRVAELRRHTIEVIAVKRGSGGLSPKTILTALAGEGITHVLVEGGAAVLTSFFEAGYVNEAAVFLAPKIYGDGLAPIRMKLPWKDRNRGEWHLTGCRRVGRDILITYRIGGTS